MCMNTSPILLHIVNMFCSAHVWHFLFMRQILCNPRSCCLSLIRFDTFDEQADDHIVPANVFFFIFVVINLKKPVQGPPRTQCSKHYCGCAVIMVPGKYKGCVRMLLDSYWFVERHLFPPALRSVAATVVMLFLFYSHLSPHTSAGWCLQRGHSAFNVSVWLRVNHLDSLLVAFYPLVVSP